MSRYRHPEGVESNMLEPMLQLQRRHLTKCPHKSKGASYQRCSCPIHAVGRRNGERVRISLETTIWQTAVKKLADIETQSQSEPKPEPVAKTLDSAAMAFEAQMDVEEATAVKNRRRMKFMRQHAEAASLPLLQDWTLEALDGYRAWRRESLSPLAWSKELQFLRQFFSWCKQRRWIAENPAKEMKMPPKAKPRPKEPYTRDEVAAIIAACDRIGHAPYERLRARAAILILRFYALRVSDVATLERARVSAGQIRVRAMKNGKDLWCPMYPEVREALDRLPEPQGWSGEPGQCPWYFWGGRSKRRYQITMLEQTLQSVFRLSGVPNAHAHRFRHTLATEMLASGATIEDVADMLGDSPNTIREHYAKWSPARQARMASILMAVHGGQSKPQTQPAEAATAASAGHVIATWLPN